MNKRSKCILALVLMMAMLLSLTACGTQKQEDAVLQYLSYATGMDENGNYNSALYNMNGSDMVGADPGCFYVSEEEDPVYGGYYYMYTSSESVGTPLLQNERYKDSYGIAYQCFRTKDLSNWELCGALDGYSLNIEWEDWAVGYYWAPEVIRNPADGLYYMYFTSVYAQGYEGKDLSESGNPYDRFAIGIATSESPMGPFKIVYDTDAESGKRVPTINFKTGCGSQHPWSVIDISPFFDDDGTLYLYFCKHSDDHYSSLVGCWGMKMNSMTEADYSTVSCMAVPGYKSVSNEQGKIEEITRGEAYYDDESNINEGPFMVKHNGTYYLTYSSNGYKHSEYSIHQALSDDPLSGFVKLDQDKGNPVMDGSQFGHMTGTAHACYTRAGDDLWIIYHRHSTVNNNGDSRSICVDRAAFVENADGQTVLTTNGPSMCLQWLPEELSGYTNIAQTATVTVSNGEGEQYLTDEALPYYNVAENMSLKAEGEVTITLSWDAPVSVSSLMIYNSRVTDTAFSKIKDIRFKTTDTVDGKPLTKVIQDLIFPEAYYDSYTQEYLLCSPAVAEFEALTVTEITITVAANDRLVETNKYGEPNTAVEISEIVVLGGQ